VKRVWRSTAPCSRTRGRCCARQRERCPNQKTFDFFKATAASDRIDRIMVSGGASRAEGFTEMLAERFEAPVEPFDPFKRVLFDAKRFSVDAAEVAPTVAVAVGLGLRRVGDR
jgi:Tfp pilus assembly PilM family ATPase